MGERGGKDVTKFEDAQHLISRDLRELKAGPFIGNGVNFENQEIAFPKGHQILLFCVFSQLCKCVCCWVLLVLLTGFC